MKRLYSISLWAIIIFSVFYFAVYTATYHRTVLTSGAQDIPVTIVIDAGHGGEDGGAVSNSGVLESKINLAIAKKAEQFCAFCGLKTQMTRHNEDAIHTEGNTIRERKISDLKQRVLIVNRIDPAILISIHQNYYPDKRYSGAQMFYANTDGSRELAQIAQDAYRNIFSVSSARTIKPAETTFLMKNIDCTGILVECGFLSNAAEDLLLQTETYQKKLAYSITYSAICYLEKGSGTFEI